MSTRRRKKSSRTRRLGGSEAQARQAAADSARFWHGTADAPETSGTKAANGTKGGIKSSGGAAPSGIAALGDAARVRVTNDPTSTVRSLGKPPLAGRETVAEHYFEAIYGRAVAMAGALAASADLLADSDEG